MHQHDVNVNSITVRRGLLQAGRYARRPYKKQLLADCIKKQGLGSKMPILDSQILEEDNSHLQVQGQRRCLHVRRNNGKNIRAGHIQ